VAGIELGNSGSVARNFDHYTIEAVSKRKCQLAAVEAGSNTSTVAMQVVGGDKKGSLKSKAVKYGRELHGSRTRE
jgi:hypothetical protein